MIYLITYDLNSPDKDYNKLYDEIKSIGEWHHPLESIWYVVSDELVDNIAKRIKDEMDANDFLFVVDISRQPRQGWLPKPTWEWLRVHDQ
ncbi:hypothetical protein [uncultured Bacteroides sp.]|uniref:hypothetical protein n=1 Tax=uncultured Bacteroides sp. TaxID=162156 RepID=UPI002AA67377|nr:hypothetical protein [uncultured Bacteroides sp.]